MLNWIWLIMVAGSVLTALAAGTLNEVTAAVLGKSKEAVMNVMLPLAGMLVLWMGIMRLVERSGLIRVISKGFSPLMRFLFPEIPAGHPVLGTIAMNMGATMLGAGNAATPLGLRAMEQLRALNPHPGVASNSMCMLLALCTSGITLIPASTIALMHARGSAQPGAVIAPSILTTLVATAGAVLACKLMQRMRVFQITPLPPEELSEEDKAAPAAEKPESVEEVTAAPHAVPVRGWRLGVLLLYAGSLLGALLWFTAAPDSLLDLQRRIHEWLKGAPPAEGLAWFQNVPPTAGRRLIEFIAAAAIPSAVGFFVLYAALAGLRVYEELVEGAKDGMAVTFRVIPYVVAILVAIGMFRESGAMDVLLNLLRGPLELLRFPVEVLPMAIIRSLSGGAAVGVLDSIIAQHGGPDALIPRIAATINGSSETTFYVAALYFGSVRVRRMRHAIPAGLVADAVSVIFAIFFCRLLLG